jgi:hypothetical protein
MFVHWLMLEKTKKVNIIKLFSSPTVACPRVCLKTC